MRTLLFAAALLAVSPARAAEAMTTDRPDYVESSDVVGPGRLQIETSFQSQRSPSGGVKTRTRTTPTLVRFGVGDTAEFRIETDGRGWARTEDASGTDRQKGWTDIAVGVKWRTQAGNEETGAPGIAWLLHVDTDSGSAAFRGKVCDPRCGRWPNGNCRTTCRSG